MPAAVMSPDDMLRAYAERKKSAAGGAISYPLPVANSFSPTSPMSPTNTVNMRPLFSPTGVVSPTNTGSGRHGKRSSVAVGQYGGARYEIGDDEDPYGGTA